MWRDVAKTRTYNPTQGANAHACRKLGWRQWCRSECVPAELDNHDLETHEHRVRRDRHPDNQIPLRLQSAHATQRDPSCQTPQSALVLQVVSNAPVVQSINRAVAHLACISPDFHGDVVLLPTSLKRNVKLETKTNSHVQVLILNANHTYDLANEHASPSQNCPQGSSQGSPPAAGIHCQECPGRACCRGCHP